MNRDHHSGRVEIRCTPNESNILPEGQRRVRQANSRYVVAATPPLRRRRNTAAQVATRNVRPRRQRTTTTATT